MLGRRPRPATAPQLADTRCWLPQPRVPFDSICGIQPTPNRQDVRVHITLHPGRELHLIARRLPPPHASTEPEPSRGRTGRLHGQLPCGPKEAAHCQAPIGICASLAVAFAPPRCSATTQSPQRHTMATGCRSSRPSRSARPGSVTLGRGATGSGALAYARRTRARPALQRSHGMHACRQWFHSLRGSGLRQGRALPAGAGAAQGGAAGPWPARVWGWFLTPACASNAGWPIPSRCSPQPCHTCTCTPGATDPRCMPWDDMIDSISAPNTTDCILTLLVQPEPENKFLPSRPINQNGEPQAPLAPATAAALMVCRWERQRVLGAPANSRIRTTVRTGASTTACTSLPCTLMRGTGAPPPTP